MLVEDDAVMQTRMRMLLQRRGYGVVVANDGVDALSLLESHPNIQFVLSDWVMPNMDGVALCKAVKAQNFNRYLFFVLLSSQDDHDSITLGINAGADDFVAKDTPLEELDARIKAGFRTLALHNELVEKNTALNQAYAQINSDLLAASDLMSRMLPVKRSYPGVELAYCYQPSAAIGGDMLGCIELDERKLAFYMLDVSGHGVASALLSFSIQQTLNAVSTDSVTVDVNSKGVRTAKPAKDVLHSLNTTYSGSDNHSLYATMVYAVLDTVSGELDVAFAGHPPLFRINKQMAKTSVVGDSGFVIGMFDFATYDSTILQLEPGEEIWLYTDGITEAKLGNDLLGEERLLELITSNQSEPIENKPQCVLNAVKAAQKNNEFEDDVSLMVVQWNGRE